MEWNIKKGLNLDNFPSTKVDLSKFEIELEKLNETQRSSYAIFAETESVDEVCVQRGLKSSSVLGHLCQAIKVGLPLDVTKLANVNPEIRLKIEKAIASPEIDSNVLRMAPIKNVLGDEVDWDQLKVVMAQLTAQFGVSNDVLQWTDDYKKSILEGSNERVDETDANERTTEVDQVKAVEVKSKGESPLLRRFRSSSREN